MPDDDPLGRERHKFVTDRQKYFTELARDAFIGAWIVIQKRPGLLPDITDKLQL